MKAKRLWQRFAKIKSGRSLIPKKRGWWFSLIENQKPQTVVLKSLQSSPQEQPVTQSSALVVVEEILDLGSLSEYQRLMLQYEKLKDQHDRLFDNLTSVINDNYLSLSKFDSLNKLVKDLQNQIRAATTGVPVNQELDAVNQDFVPELELQGGEQNREARRYMCKSLYRKLAAILHPDKGGDPELFRQVNIAYRRKDFFLLEMYYQDIVLSKDLKWQQSEGLARVKDLVKKPLVDIQMMKQSILWLAYVAHIKGDTQTAEFHVVSHLSKLAEVLQKELDHIYQSRSNKNGN